MGGFWPNLHSYIVETGTRLIRFWWPWPHFQSHTRAYILENGPHRSHTHTHTQREIIDVTFVNNRSVQTCGGHTFSSENTVLVNIPLWCILFQSYMQEPSHPCLLQRDQGHEPRDQGHRLRIFIKVFSQMFFKVMCLLNAVMDFVDIKCHPVFLI